MKLKFSNKLYDILKLLCTIILPACGTLYFALSQIWGFAFGEEIVGTITALSTFIGTCIGISNYNYKHAEVSSCEKPEEPDELGSFIETSTEEILPEASNTEDDA